MIKPGARPRLAPATGSNAGDGRRPRRALDRRPPEGYPHAEATTRDPTTSHLGTTATTSKTMRTTLLLLGLGLGTHALASAQAPMDFHRLVDRRGVYLHPETLEPYTGPVLAMWDASTVRLRGTLRNGRWDGVRELFHLDGKLELRETYRNGVLDGPFESYFRSGRLSDRGTYRNGVLEGAYEAYWSRAQGDMQAAHAQHGAAGHDAATMPGDLMERGVMSSGRPCGDWYRFLPTSYMGYRAGSTVSYPPCPSGGE